MTMPMINNEPVKVKINDMEIVNLAEPAAAIMIGNPGIADVSIHSSQTFFVLGRGYGDTSLKVLNADGDVIMDTSVSVGASISQNDVRIYNGGGLSRSTFNCSPQCQPAPQLGDESEFSNAYKSSSPAISGGAGGVGGVSSGGTFGSATETGMGVEQVGSMNGSEGLSEFGAGN